MHNYIGLKCLRKPSFFPCDLCSRNSPARVIIFSQSHLNCYLPSGDRCHGNNLLSNRTFFYFSYFFCNFSSFLRWKFFKICAGEYINLTLLIPYFPKILCSKLFFNVKTWYFFNISKNLFHRNVWKNRIGKVWPLSWTVQIFKIIYRRKRKIFAFIFGHFSACDVILFPD